MDRQYKPLHYTIDNFPVIVYATKDESPITEVLPTQTELKAYVESLIMENANIRTGNYAVIFVWNNLGKPMGDVWMMEENTESNSGPLVECFAFAGKEQSVSGDIASGDTVIALAAEEQKRRQFSELSQYLSDESPAPFPEGMTPQEEYPQ
jgi:hypothetical protein